MYLNKDEKRIIQCWVDAWLNGFEDMMLPGDICYREVTDLIEKLKLEGKDKLYQNFKDVEERFNSLKWNS